MLPLRQCLGLLAHFQMAMSHFKMAHVRHSGSLMALSEALRKLCCSLCDLLWITEALEKACQGEAEPRHTHPSAIREQS